METHIHLFKWSAKLFGFKQHIVNGIWTKSYCISMLQKINPSILMQAFENKITFKQPLYLASQVNIAILFIETNSAHNEQHFKVISNGLNNEQPLHLIGKIRVI
jgi:acyl dehydratase